MDITVLISIASLVLTPSAALGGVFLGQWMQRRTTREQLAAQDRRDELARAHEDRHRFTEERRAIYANFLAATTSFDDLVTGQRRILEPAMEAEAEHSPIDADFAAIHNRLVVDRGFDTAVDAAMLEYNKTLGNLELTAGDPVRASAYKLMHALMEYAILSIQSWQPRSAARRHEDAKTEREKVRNLMRSELGIVMPSE
ncbi:hypothetical protein GCM10017691_24090 [Pseudonocardia petroleophila]|uniref:Uncharacterized protein n=1 Tax=Pseudonocardia petroleophila TaxID=37331 RepID=A0A7G7MFT5_9PSEU|nr:hypothetical protein [Pseudonocardia petroleophila]QNG51646.1 hypothetical protein H6H00_26660 [Pseudonocardia petroleophila]